MSRDTWSNANNFLHSRRDFLSAGASLAVLPWVAQIAAGIPLTRFAWSKNPFQLGVASGDPTSDGVVLWTRLAPEPHTGEGLPDSSIEVTWEISSDESMQQIIRTGKTLASPALNHSVHVEVDGLSPDRWYYYRFHAGDATSPTGRTRTMPATSVLPDRLRFAFASCQHYEAGLYTAYEHMVRDELDLILHLGDYIYEGPAGKSKLRQHNSPEIISLQDYRNRYGLYKSDQHLINAHQQAPWIVVWDDHEFDNNYANLISEELHIDPRDFLLRRVNAYQAYYENMPLRSSAIPKGPDMLLYRSILFGQLANFAMLDTRQYRSDQPNGDGRKPLEGQVFHPKGTLLGETQEEWLMSNLRKSDSRWNVLGQQVMVARVDRVPGETREYSMDQWSGYDVARKRLLQEISKLERANTVVLTGDIHTNWANELKIDFDDLDSPSVATEFVGTSISSGGNGYDQPKELNALLSENPFVKYHNGERGYVRCDVTATTWKTDYQTVSYVDKPGAPIQTRASFIVEHDRPKIERA